MRKLKLFSLVFWVVLIALFFSACVAKVPTPRIKEGRFDFSVDYEINGELKNYSGTYICKFDGAYASLAGKGRDWNGYVEDGIQTEIAVETNEHGTIYLDLGLYPEYFMSDPDYLGSRAPEPSLYMIYHTEDLGDLDIDGELDFFAIYGVRIVGYEYPQPIQNIYDEAFSRCDFGIN
jgi:hypothetical protein